MHLCSSIWSGDVSGLCFLQPLMFKPKNYHVLTWKRQTYQVAVYQKDVSGGVEQKTGVGAVVVQEYLDVSAAVSRAGRPDRCRPSRLRRLIADAHSLKPFAPPQTADSYLYTCWFVCVNSIQLEVVFSTGLSYRLFIAFLCWEETVEFHYLQSKTRCQVTLLQKEDIIV